MDAIGLRGGEATWDSKQFFFLKEVWCKFSSTRAEVTRFKKINKKFSRTRAFELEFSTINMYSESPPFSIFFVTEGGIIIELKS